MFINFMECASHSRRVAMHRFLMVPVAALGWLVAGSGAFGNPVYTLTIEDSAGSVTQTDNGTGTVTYSGTLGGFSISSMSVTDLNPTNPLDVAFGSQDIFSATGSDTLHVFVTVSNLPAPVPTMMTIGTTSQANFQGSKILGWSTQTYYDPNDETGPAGVVDLLSTAGGGVSKNGFLNTSMGTTLLDASPFSYTVEYSLQLLKNEFANGAGATTDVILAEPGSWRVFVAGLLFVGLMRLAYAGTVGWAALQPTHARKAGT
jgi:hypothetical protein